MPTTTKQADLSEKRGEYVERMKEQLDEWNAWIGRAEKRLEEKTAPSRAKLEEQVESAKRNYQTGLAKLQEIRDGGEEQFQRLRDEAEHVWKAFRHSVNYFKSQL